MSETMSLALASPVLAALAAVWALLASASAGVLLVARRRSAEAARELTDRTKSWWWILAIVTAALAAGPKGAILLISALSFLAFRELHSIVPVRPSDRGVLALAYLAIPIQGWCVWTGWYGLFSIFVPVYAFVVLTAATVIAGEMRDFIKASATLQWALMLTVYNLGHLAFLVVLPLREAAPAGGVGLLL